MIKRTKVITSILLTLLFVFLITSCGESNKAETAVRGMLSAFKNLDFEKAQNYVDVDKIAESNNFEVTGNTKLIMETVFDKLNYRIISSKKIDENNVVVRTRITAIDMRPVLGEFATKAFTFAFSNALLSSKSTTEETKDKMVEMLIECASKPDLETITSNIDINVCRGANNKWKIDADETLSNAILGGFKNAIDEIENPLN